jgi:hypothetical protein
MFLWFVGVCAVRRIRIARSVCPLLQKLYTACTETTASGARHEDFRATTEGRTKTLSCGSQRHGDTIPSEDRFQLLEVRRQWVLPQQGIGYVLRRNAERQWLP